MKKSSLRSKLICMVMLSVIMLSCATSKQNFKASLAEKTSVVSAVDSASKVLVSTKQVSGYNIDSSINEAEIVRTTDIILSTPDSSGKQYPLRITQTVKLKNKKISVAAFSLLVSDTQKTINKTSASRESLQTKRSESDLREVIKKPPSVYPLAFVLLIVSCIILLIIYRTPAVNFLKRIKTLFNIQ